MPTSEFSVYAEQEKHRKKEMLVKKKGGGETCIFKSPKNFSSIHNKYITLMLNIYLSNVSQVYNILMVLFPLLKFN